jgi:hypothetical protein
MTTEAGPTRCDKCDGPLINNVIGKALCPAGCGGLHPLLDPQTHAANRREVIIRHRMPEATELLTVCASPNSKFRSDVPFTAKQLFRVEGQSGIWRRMKRQSATLTDHAPGNILAWRSTEDGPHVLELRRDEKMEMEIDGALRPPPCEAV